MVLAETFSHDIFRKSLERMFASGPDGLLQMAFNASVEVRGKSAIPVILTLK